MDGIPLKEIAFALGGVGACFCGVMMAGAPLWPQQAEQFKKQLPTVITGIVIVLIGGPLIEMISGM